MNLSAMKRISGVKALFFVGALWMASAGSVEACAVPVFRYALERWAPRPYELIVFHEDDLPATARETIRKIEMTPVNLAVWAQKVSEIDEKDEMMREIWEEEKERARLPWAVLRFPHQYWKATKKKTVWSGALDETELNAVIDSPVRRRISESILKGASTVWLFVEGEDARENERLAQTLKERLRHIDDVVELPADILAAANEGPMGKEQKGFVPMKVSNEVIRVAHDRKDEFFLLQMLTNMERMSVSEQDKARTDRPALAFPVFGQGRALWPLVGSGIQPDLIDEAVTFILGPCSCTIQDSNPGVDLLMHANWYEGVANLFTGYSDAPPLVGLAQPLPDTAGDSAPPQTTVPSATAPEDPPPTRSLRGKTLAAVLGLALVAIALLGVRRLTRDRE
jgi:hypothetical protein